MGRREKERQAERRWQSVTVERADKVTNALVAVTILDFVVLLLLFVFVQLLLL